MGFELKKSCRLTLILIVFFFTGLVLLESSWITESTDSYCVNCLSIEAIKLLGNVDLRCFLPLLPFLDEAKALFNPMLLPVLGLIPVLIVIELLGIFTTCLSVK